MIFHKIYGSDPKVGSWEPNREHTRRQIGSIAQDERTELPILNPGRCRRNERASATGPKASTTTSLVRAERRPTLEFTTNGKLDLDPPHRFPVRSPPPPGGGPRWGPGSQIANGLVAVLEVLGNRRDRSAQEAAYPGQVVGEVDPVDTADTGAVRVQAE